MPTLPPGCELIETMRVMPDGDIPLWPSHYKRLERSATALGFPFDRPALTEVKKKIVIEAKRTPQRCRLTLNRDGELTFPMLPLSSIPEPVSIRICESPSVRPPEMRFLEAFKVSSRDHYDRAFAERGTADDVLLLNEAEEVTECTIYNIYIENKAGIFTPPLQCGLLPGIERTRLIEAGWATEQTLSISDVTSASQLYVSNAVRGCLRASLT